MNLVILCMKRNLQKNKRGFLKRKNIASRNTTPGIPGLVQMNITNSAEEIWALLDKDIEMEDSETENENRNGRTILHHTISSL